MVQDTSLVKEKIMSFLKVRGPSLPVHISREIDSSILFSSAFLSELLSEKRIRVSHMRVGSSPIYFILGQEHLLEKFSQYLKSREKEAFFLLKEKRFLKDREQIPAIRVALREIRDFALPFNLGEEVIWRYFLVPESEFEIKEKKIEVEIKKEFPKESILGKDEKPKVRVLLRKKKASKKDDRFFSSIKEFLSENTIDLVDIESFGKKEIVLKVRDKEGDKLLVAYNKSKITDEDIIKASKKASELKLQYIILGTGGPLKKLYSLIEALKGMSSIKKIK